MLNLLENISIQPFIQYQCPQCFTKSQGQLDKKSICIQCGIATLKLFDDTILLKFIAQFLDDVDYPRLKIANSIHIREIFEDTDLSNYLINVSLTLFIENDLIPFINNIIEQSHREKGLTPKSDKNSQFFDKIDTLIKQMTIYQKKITLLKKSLLRKETNNLLQDVLSLYSKMYQESHNTKILDSEKKKSKGFDLELAKTLHRFHTYHDQMQNLSKTLVSNYKQMINNYETIQNNNFFQFPVVIRKVYEFNAIVFAFNSLILQ